MRRRPERALEQETDQFMPNKKRDPRAASVARDTTDEAPIADGELEPEPGILDDAEEDIELVTEGDAAADVDAPPIDHAVGAAAAVDAGRRGRKGQPARIQAATPSVSDRAVRINDRASAIFVLGLVAMFALILLSAMLVGPGSLFGNVFKSAATPVPAVESTEPSESASGVPSESAPGSESPAASGSAAPSASPAASPSAEASPNPSAS